MNLIIDIGNTRAKVAVMERGEVVEEFASEGFEAERVEEISRRFGVERAIVCSTRGDGEQVREAVKRFVGRVVLFDSATPIPIANSYSTPATLGRDRLAAAVGAWTLSKAENQLVIDMGTAITIDLVTRAGGFEGGVISPGVVMRFKALHDYTSALPLCEATERDCEVPRTSREAIEQGVMQGVQYEIEGHIAKMRKKVDKIELFFTGGDAKYFEKRIKNTIFAARELVAVGLNRILEYNAE